MPVYNPSVFIHAPATFCTLSKPTCVKRPAFAPHPPPPCPHPGEKPLAAFTSFSHPLSTQAALYPRKTSLYARFRDIGCFEGGGFHRIHIPCSWLISFVVMCFRRGE